VSKERLSLLAGRHKAPLTSEDVRRASNVFLGLEDGVNVRHDPTSVTAFRVTTDDAGNTYGEIVFGADIYPGTSVADPNSALSLEGAAAHELTHFHRWSDKSAISDETLEHVDEALTSLQAILRYDHKLSRTDIRGLVSDATQRLRLYVNQLKSIGATEKE
jgi:hypothetical protein